MLSGDRAERYIQSRGEQSQPCASLGPTHVLASAGTSVVADERALVLRSSLGKARAEFSLCWHYPLLQSLHCRER